MVFSGIPFLFYFLPLFLLAYFLFPSRCRNVVLVVSSLLFYAWGEPRYVPVLVFTIVQGFFFGRLIEQGKHRKCFLGLSIGCSLTVLVILKYGNFLVDNLNRLTGAQISLGYIALPIGISFYTFQVISYVVDVYRKKVPAQKQFMQLAMYIAMFPQLVAGPIVRYGVIEQELATRKVSGVDLTAGIRRFIIGLSKKVLLANSLGAFCNAFSQSEEKGVLFTWLYGISFAFQIYYDFSGYSDMAIGLGRILGFHFPENFNYPFVAKSATEFCRRWHISLGTWFRDYVYIPLGGNRVSKHRFFFNLLIVWSLTGLWHGASWNFVLWGLLFAGILMLEKSVLLVYLEKAKVWNHIYMFFVITLSFLLFDSVDLAKGATHLRVMFGGSDLPFFTQQTGYWMKQYFVIWVISCLGATPLPARWINQLKERALGRPWRACIWNVAEGLMLIALFIIVVGFLVDGAFNPFLYFRF